MTLLAWLALSGCSAAKPSENLRDFDHAYRQGQQGRTSMLHRGVGVTDKSCGQLYDDSQVQDGYGQWSDHSGDQGYWDDLRISYVNGCMNRPNNLHGGSISPSPTKRAPSSTARPRTSSSASSATRRAD
jgi:hypothetical protein